MAVYFSEERIYGSDASSYLFGVVNNEWFYTERGRIIIWLSQWFPLLAVWAGLSMKSVLIAHSLGHVLFFYSIFLLGHFYYRKVHIGALMLVIQTLAVTEAYFAWPYGEVYYGVALVVVLILMISDERPFEYWSAAFITAVCLFLVMGHPLVLPSLVLAMTLLFLRNGPTVELLWSAASILLFGFFRYVLFSSYDGQLANQFLASDRLSLPYMVEFLGLIRTYHIACSALCVIFVYLLIRRRWTPVILSIGSLVLISIIITRFAPLNGATQQYYQAYSGVFVVLTQIEVFGGAIRKQTIRLFSFVLLIVVSLSTYKIYLSSGPVKAHIERLKTIAKDLSRLSGNRFIINGYNMYGDSTLIWKSSEPFHEMILLSSALGKPILLRVFERGMEYYEWQMNDIIPVEGPEAPRVKNKSYQNIYENRMLMAEWLQHVEPEFSPKYFELNLSTDYNFLNASDTAHSTSLPEVKLRVQKESLSNGMILRVELCNEGEPLLSDARYEVKLVVIGRNGRDTIVWPLTKDGVFCSSEIIYVPDWWCSEPLQITLQQMGRVIAEVH